MAELSLISRRNIRSSAERWWFWRLQLHHAVLINNINLNNLNSIIIIIIKTNNCATVSSMALVPVNVNNSPKKRGKKEEKPGTSTTGNVNEKLAISTAGNVEFDDIISDHAQYGRIQYWDMRYANEHEPFEWYYGYEYFRDTILDAIPLHRRTMVAGCGSSFMLGDMADDGYENLVGADWSRVVIAQLKYRYRDYPEIEMFQGNLVDTDLPEASFGAIVDKAVMDSMLCTNTSTVTISQYIYEVRSLLK